MMNVYIMFYTKYLCVWVVIIGRLKSMVNSSIYELTIIMCSCSLAIPKLLNIPNNYEYVKIEIFWFLKLLWQVCYHNKVFKLETLVFYATQNSH